MCFCSYYFSVYLFSIVPFFRLLFSYAFISNCVGLLFYLCVWWSIHPDHSVSNIHPIRDLFHKQLNGNSSFVSVMKWFQAPSKKSFLSNFLHQKLSWLAADISYRMSLFITLLSHPKPSFICFWLCKQSVSLQLNMTLDMTRASLWISVNTHSWMLCMDCENISR